MFLLLTAKIKLTCTIKTSGGGILTQRNQRRVTNWNTGLIKSISGLGSKCRVLGQGFWKQQKRTIKWFQMKRTSYILKNYLVRGTISWIWIEFCSSTALWGLEPAKNIKDNISTIPLHCKLFWPSINVLNQKLDQKLLNVASEILNICLFT